MAIPNQNFTGYMPQPTAYGTGTTPTYTAPVYQPPGPRIIWVRGEQEVNNYPVLPGNSVLLMDMENLVLYLKSTDISGQPFPIEVYDLVKRVPQTKLEEPKPIDMSEFVKKNELSEYFASALEEALSGKKARSKKSVKEDLENE